MGGRGEAKRAGPRPESKEGRATSNFPSLCVCVCDVSALGVKLEPKLSGEGRNKYSPAPPCTRFSAAVAPPSHHPRTKEGPSTSPPPMKCNLKGKQKQHRRRGGDGGGGSSLALLPGWFVFAAGPPPLFPLMTENRRHPSSSSFPPIHFHSTISSPSPFPARPTARDPTVTRELI